MSVTEMDIESTIAHIVEAMLPRCSDDKLGLLIRLRIDASDFGYAEDGNTLVREPQNIRRHLNFIFVRSSNYTRVFLFEPDEKDGFVAIVGKENLWEQQSYHDSCWRSDGMRRITDVYFETCEPICKARECAPKDVHTFNGLDYDPQYVALNVYEQNDPLADRYSKEGRVWRILPQVLDFDQLVQRTYRAKDLRGKMQTFKTGLYIKNSERDKEFCKNQGI